MREGLRRCIDGRHVPTVVAMREPVCVMNWIQNAPSTLNVGAALVSQCAALESPGNPWPRLQSGWLRSGCA
jgi:hypothetical protein